MKEDIFTIYSDLSEPEIQQYLGASCFFRSYFNDIFLQLEDKKVKIYIFRNNQDYISFCKKIKHQDSPYGFYSDDIKLMVINHEGGIKTIFHELVHFFIESSDYEFSEWIEEGLALFFEKSVGYYKNENENSISFGYFNPWRFAEVQDLYSTGRTSLEYIRENQSLSTCFLLFIHKNGKLKKFLDLYLQYRDEQKAISETFNQSIEQVEKTWRDWIEEQFYNKNVNFLETSILFDSKEDLQRFIKSKKAYWNETKQIYEIGTP